MENVTLNQEVMTPFGKAKITVIDRINKNVRVVHLESKIPITDFRFEDLKELNS